MSLLLLLGGAGGPGGPTDIFLPSIDASSVPAGPEFVGDPHLIELPSIDASSVPAGPAFVGLAATFIDLASIDGASVPTGLVLVSVVDPAAFIELALPSIDGSSIPDGPLTIDRIAPAYVPDVDYGIGDTVTDAQGVTWVATTSGTSVGDTVTDDVFLALGPVWVIVDEYLPTCYAWLYANDGTLLSTLDNAFGLSWQDPFNDVGTGSITVMADDPAAALFTVGCTVRCFIYGIGPVFTFTIDKEPSRTVISEGEESAQVVAVTGPGLISVFEDVAVYPFKGTAAQFVSQHRLYTFASPDHPNSGDWGPAHAGQQQRYIDPVRHDVIEYTTDLSEEDDIVEFVPAAAPLGWLVPEARWIWGSPDTWQVGFCYFRKTFTLSQGTDLIIAVTGDNWYTLYLDGTPLLGDGGEGGGWKEYRTADLFLPAGEYTLAAVVENAPLPDSSPWNNPAGLLVAVYTVDEDDKLASTIVISDDTWTAIGYPTLTPGWTPGQIIIDQIAEAQARGMLPGLMWSFLDWCDSNGDTWQGEIGPWSWVPGFAIPIGGTLFDVLNALKDAGWIDYRMRSNGMLDVFNQGNQHHTVTVLVQTGDTATQNLVDLEFSAQEPPTTALLVKWEQGFLDVTDAGAATTYGRREAFVSIDAESREEVIRQASLTLADIAHPRTAIVAEIDPVSYLDQAYYQFLPGQWLTCPDRDGTPAEVQVQSISVEQTEMGQARVVCELGERLLARERENMKLLQTLGRGVTGNTKIRNAANQTTGQTHG